MKLVIGPRMPKFDTGEILDCNVVYCTNYLDILEKRKNEAQVRNHKLTS